MKVTIDLAQSPKALEDELTRVIRLALGLQYYIEKSESGNFTNEELSDPATNLAGASAPSAVVDLIPPIGGAAATLPSATTVATASSGVDLDSEGQPWDANIHSAGKSKIANGTWKLKKGVDKALVDQIKERNKALVSNPAPASNVVALPTLPSAVTPLPTLPPVAQVAAPDVEIVVTDYASFAAYVGQQMAHKPKATKENADRGLSHYGMVDAQQQPDITALAHRPDLIDPLYKWLKAVIDLSPAE